MAKPKELLLQNKEVVAKIIAMLNSNEFEVWLTFTRAEFSLRSPTAEQGKGAVIFENVMRSMTDSSNEAPGWDSVITGAHLHHELEIPIQHRQQQSEQPKTANA